MIYQEVIHTEQNYRNLTRKMILIILLKHLIIEIAFLQNKTIKSQRTKSFLFNKELRNFWKE